MLLRLADRNACAQTEDLKASESQLYCYENTLDHARAFFAYRDRIQIANKRRRR